MKLQNRPRSRVGGCGAWCVPKCRTRPRGVRGAPFVAVSRTKGWWALMRTDPILDEMKRMDFSFSFPYNV